MKKDKRNIKQFFVPDNTIAVFLKGYQSEQYSFSIMKLGVKP